MELEYKAGYIKHQYERFCRELSDDVLASFARIESVEAFNRQQERISKKVEEYLKGEQPRIVDGFLSYILGDTPAFRVHERELKLYTACVALGRPPLHGCLETVLAIQGTVLKIVGADVWEELLNHVNNLPLCDDHPPTGRSADEGYDARDWRETQD